MLALDRTRTLQSAVLEHHDLLDAIARGKGARAAELMRAHVEHFERAMRDVLLEA
jgi:DNA-binding GntR family transcriptional regulator